ncbi:MAG: hypothetical protein V4440_08610, partial [Pseudomonadota bacterium]
NASLTLNPSGNGRAYPYTIIRFMGATDADTTTQIAVAPRALSGVSLKFLLSNSSVTTQGE